VLQTADEATHLVVEQTADSRRRVASLCLLGTYSATMSDMSPPVPCHGWKVVVVLIVSIIALLVQITGTPGALHFCRLDVHFV